MSTLMLTAIKWLLTAQNMLDCTLMFKFEVSKISFFIIKK